MFEKQCFQSKRRSAVVDRKILEILSKFLSTIKAILFEGKVIHSTERVRKHPERLQLSYVKKENNWLLLSSTATSFSSWLLRNLRKYKYYLNLYSKISSKFVKYGFKGLIIKIKPFASTLVLNKVEYS